MPLDKSGSQSAFQNNIKREMNNGKSQNQAVAIAYSAQGEQKPKEKKFRFKKLSDQLKGKY